MSRRDKLARFISLRQGPACWSAVVPSSTSRVCAACRGNEGERGRANEDISGDSWSVRVFAAAPPWRGSSAPRPPPASTQRAPRRAPLPSRAPGRDSPHVLDPPSRARPRVAERRRAAHPSIRGSYVSSAAAVRAPGSPCPPRRLRRRQVPHRLHQADRPERLMISGFTRSECPAQLSRGGTSGSPACAGEASAGVHLRLGGWWTGWHEPRRVTQSTSSSGDPGRRDSAPHAELHMSADLRLGRAPLAQTTSHCLYASVRTSRSSSTLASTETRDHSYVSVRASRSSSTLVFTETRDHSYVSVRTSRSSSTLVFTETRDHSYVHVRAPRSSSTSASTETPLASDHQVRRSREQGPVSPSSACLRARKACIQDSRFPARAACIHPRLVRLARARCADACISTRGVGLYTELRSLPHRPLAGACEPKGIRPLGRMHPPTGVTLTTCTPQGVHPQPFSRAPVPVSHSTRPTGARASTPAFPRTPPTGARASTPAFRCMRPSRAHASNRTLQPHAPSPGACMPTNLTQPYARRSGAHSLIHTEPTPACVAPRAPQHVY